MRTFETFKHSSKHKPPECDRIGPAGEMIKISQPNSFQIIHHIHSIPPPQGFHPSQNWVYPSQDSEKFGCDSSPSVVSAVFHVQAEKEARLIGAELAGKAFRWEKYIDSHRNAGE
jgi:hypothetical protein